MTNTYRVLITGTRKGIGRELAEYYLGKGYHVFGCSRNKTDLKNAKYTHFCIDVADENGVKSMCKEIKNEVEGLDILINNAGTASMNHFLLTPFESVENLFRTNFYGSFLCSREAAKLMQRNSLGRIINFSTVAVALNLEGESIYAASKSAVEQFTRIAAKELGNMGITVNSVAPTPIETDLIKGVPKNKIEKLIDEQAIKRLGEFKDIINVIDFFISEKSDFVTGQTIYLGGVF